MAVPGETPQIRLGHRQRKESRPRRDGNIAASLAQRGDVRPGTCRDGLYGPGKGFGRGAVEKRARRDPRFGQQRQGDVKPSLAGMKRDRPQYAGEAETESRLPGEAHGFLVLRTERLAGELDQGNGGVHDVFLERVHIVERSVAEIGRTTVEDRVKAGTLQAAGSDRLGERRENRVLAHRPVIEPVDRLAPPLQPDLPQQRLRYDFRGLGGLQVEGAEGEQRVPPPAGGEQRGKVALAVETADFGRAVGTGIGQHLRLTEPAYIAAMRPTTPLDPRRFAAWPDVFAGAPALEEARALADDTTRPAEARGDALGRLAESSDDPVLKRCYEAHRKAVTAGRFRNWSDLVSYAGFAVAPVARSFVEASEIDSGGRRHLEAFCMAAHLLDLLAHCRAEFAAHGRIYLPGDWMRQAGVVPEDLAAPNAASGRRETVDRMLDRIEPTLEAAFPVARSIPDPRLRLATTAEIAERRRLARRLRKADPIAGTVSLTALDRIAVWLRTRLGRRRRA